jgi:hypothetical protein
MTRYAELARLYLGFGAFDGCAQTCAKIIGESPSYAGLPNVIFLAAIALMHLRMFDESAACVLYRPFIVASYILFALVAHTLPSSASSARSAF